MRSLSRLTIVVLLTLSFAPGLLWGQTSGTVTGQVVDQSGAVMPGAQVVLTDVATKSILAQPTNAVGRFAFVNVKPGTYDVSVTAKGFRKLTVPSQEVVVGQSLTLNLTMEVGAATQTVEVKAIPGAELQTLNSTMGTTLGGDTMLALPNQNRDATSLLIFQPMTAPSFGGAESNTTGGQVAGSMSDQNTFTLDGGNATDDLAGDNNYVASNRGYVGPQAAIPTPVESIEEFKVATNNQTADFSSSAGGEVMLVTKRGTNTMHGSVYDYFQANWLDARGWNLNSVYGEDVPTVKQHQNRFGGSLGGPVLPSFLGGKTYLYGNYEGRRYPYANGRFERADPSAMLREGIIQEYDTSGNLMQYNLATSTACGTTGGVACDPRGIGINPVISTLWSKYMPPPNDCSNSGPEGGDNLNVCGYYGALKLPIRDDFLVGRLDHDFGAKWRAYASYRFYNLTYPSTNQVDIGGVEPGDTLGTLASQSSNPAHPRYGVLGLTGTLTPALTNEFHISYLRDDWNWKRAGVPTGVLGIPGGLEVGGETANLLAPMDFDTQDARFRTWDGHDWTIADSLNWLKGNHFLQVGGQVFHWWDNHVRPDNVTGSLTQLVYQINNQGSLLWNANNIPMECTGSGQTGCMDPSLEGSWKGYYAEMAGIVGSASQLFVRGGTNFSLTGAPYLQDHAVTDGYSLYFTDSFKIRPNLTLNYGLEWGTQMPPVEKNGIQDIFTDAEGNAIAWQGFVNNQIAASLNGQVYNPVLGYVPVLGMGTHQKYPYTPFYGAFSPRVSLAYSPKANPDTILGKLFGNKQTVIRGGYVRIYDRNNAVNNALTPLLGYGFGQPIRCSGMSSAGACTNTTASTAPGAETLSSGQVVPAAFRIGVDGNTAPFPVVTQTLPVPAEPGVNAPGASVLFALDPNYRPGSDDQIDFSIQRELPGQMILEVGYNGRWAKHLYLGTDLDGVPPMLTLGGQTYAQAYNGLYQANLKGGPVAAQPFFETALGGPNSKYCSGYSSCSAAVLANEGSTGTENLRYYSAYSVFADLDSSGAWNFPGCVGCPVLPADLQHYAALNDATTAGYANYQALIVSLQKRAGQGLTVSGNFTYSHSLDTIGINQEFVEDSPNYPWNLHYDYGPAPWDRTLVMNILAHYELPFGKGKYFATHNAVLDRIVGGWTISPIYTWGTGVPIESYTGSCQELGQNPNIPWCSGEVPLVNTGIFGHSANTNVHLTSDAIVAGPTYGTLVGYGDDPYPDCAGQVCTTGASGANLFKNPAQVYNSYRPLLLGVDTGSLDLGPYHGQHRWDLDFTIAKQTHIKERWNATFYAQFLNAFNHMEYSDPSMNFLSPSNFGSLTTQYNGPRVIELGLRIAF